MRGCQREKVADAQRVFLDVLLELGEVITSGFPWSLVAAWLCQVDVRNFAKHKVIIGGNANTQQGIGVWHLHDERRAIGLQLRQMVDCGWLGRLQKAARICMKAGLYLEAFPPSR